MRSSSAVLARLLYGGPRTAGEKPGTAGTRPLHGARNALRQAHRAAGMSFEHECEGATLAVKGRKQLRATVGLHEHVVDESLQRDLLVAV